MNSLDAVVIKSLCECFKLNKLDITDFRRYSLTVISKL